MRLAWALILGCLGLAGQDLKLTLEEAERLAVQNHPQIAASRYLAQAAAQVPLELRGGLFPVFSGAITGAGTDGDCVQPLQSVAGESGRD